MNCTHRGVANLGVLLGNGDNFRVQSGVGLREYDRNYDLYGLFSMHQREVRLRSSTRRCSQCEIEFHNSQLVTLVVLLGERRLDESVSNRFR